MAEDFSGMTVNERLFSAGLLAAHDAALAVGDDTRVDALLAEVGLKRDTSGMNWPADQAQGCKP